MQAESCYIHIPFCRAKCGYCSFFSDTYKSGIALSYVDALKKKIAGVDGRLKTIFIGGGTPSVLSLSLLKRFLKCLKKNISSHTEFTIEVNPESLTKDKLSLFSDSGVNRLSIGVQSFFDNKLKNLGRIHDGQCSRKALELALKTKLNNISIDLMFGIFCETKKTWLDDLKVASRYPLAHISCYNLVLEEKCPLYQKKKLKKSYILEDNILADMYKTAVSFLKEQGLERYEVSNFSRNGFQCRHNLNYWQNNPFFGIGASAVSYIDGVRKKSESNIRSFIKEGNRFDFQEKLPAKKRAKETAALKIRTAEGINFSWFKDKTGFDFLSIESGAYSYLKENKMIVDIKSNKRTTGIKLNNRGFLFSDIASINLL